MENRFLSCTSFENFLTIGMAVLRKYAKEN